MISNKIIPAHILALYTWQLVDANTNLEKINGLIPISAIEDEPALSDSGMPYLIYGYGENEGGNAQHIKRGIFTLRIMSKTFSELGHITNVLNRGFENDDETAEKVNIWSSINQDLCGIRFTYICTSFIEGGSPPVAEGGMFEGLISLSYHYVTHQKVIHPVSGGLWP